MDKFGVVRDDVTPVPKNDPKKDVHLEKCNPEITHKMASVELSDELGAITERKRSNKSE